MNYLARLQEKNEQKCPDGELHKLQKDFTQFLQLPHGTKKTVFLDATVGDTATASRWWLLHFADRDPVEVACSPVATHAEILASYPDALAAEPFEDPTITPPTAPLSRGEEASIRRWLALIEETDPAIIEHVAEQCRLDAEARRYFIERAAAELPKKPNDPLPRDDRRTCDQCVNLVARRCQAARRGEIVANRDYEPIRDLPRRCEGYAPGPDDPDRRPGAERWPGLLQERGPP